MEFNAPLPKFTMASIDFLGRVKSSSSISNQLQKVWHVQFCPILLWMEWQRFSSQEAHALVADASPKISYRWGHYLLS